MNQQKEEQLRTKQNQGMAAQHLLHILDPVLAEQGKALLEKMKSDVRGKEATEMSLFTDISQLICLEDLRGRFESRIKAGQKALKEINNGN